MSVKGDIASRIIPPLVIVGGLGVAGYILYKKGVFTPVTNVINTISEIPTKVVETTEQIINYANKDDTTRNVAILGGMGGLVAKSVWDTATADNSSSSKAGTTTQDTSNNTVTHWVTDSVGYSSKAIGRKVD